MAIIDEELNKIKHAIYGKDVRGSIHDGIDKTNKETELTTAKADGAVAQVNNIQSQVDNLVVEGDSSVEAAQARVDKGGESYPTLKDRLDAENTEVTQQLAQTQADLNDRGVNLRILGAVLDGVADDYEIVMNALAEYKHVVCPPDGIIGTSDTIFVDTGQFLEGATKNIMGYHSSPTIKYIGEVDKMKSVIIIGKNDVGEEPIKASSDVRLQNFYVDGNQRAGFGVYGTYFTNETAFDNIVTNNTLEQGIYFARSWYASLGNLTSMNSRGAGISLGMPLELLDGTRFDWTTSSPLELNNVGSGTLRSVRAGTYFSEENPGLFDPTNLSLVRRGYGIGAGIGSGFRLENFLSEGSGGVNLYVYTGSQPSKSIRNGYLENTNRNSTLSATERCGILIEHTHNSGGLYEISDVFSNYSNGGGIYHIGSERQVLLKNIQQPRFLKSLEGLDDYELFKTVLKDNVYHDCGVYNTDISKGITIAKEKVNTRYEWEIPILGIQGGRTLVFMKNIGDEPPLGSCIVEFESGTESSYTLPVDLPNNEWTYMRTITHTAIEIRKGGGTSDYDSDIIVKLVAMPPTN